MFPYVAISSLTCYYLFGRFQHHLLTTPAAWHHLW